MEKRLDSVSSVIGLGLTTVGFGFTIWKVLAAKFAAVQAHKAASDAQETDVFISMRQDLGAG